MAVFEFSGFFTIPMEVSAKGYRSIDEINVKTISKTTDSSFGTFLNKNGVYVFSLKVSQGRKPWYVGKSVKSNFAKEAFNARNCLALNKLINDKKGTLEVSFLSQQRVRGKPNLREISEIEYLLIGHAAERNDGLLNKHYTNQNDTFSIKNIYNSGRGRSNKSETEFKKLMGL